ncbi:tyrosine-type recombinase/integrase [Roseovarius rhodophyticola]|uniref:Tyrosine-type recombinase/integrase n=1 Tax=Roseovarius rhodophyticola TaxID=3080827 RepID=A0ABZ2TK08_9RHOB|nr:tyrosine-type recombinase/integrase [Roseovarius sp. W115]MDV2928260.1 tyrosine-type recombinase/integrase [Roseovarius sp. W115]
MSIAKRGRLYHLRRRVPRRYGGVELRETVWISLHTDSEMVARSKADRAWSQMIEAWEARLAGDSRDAEARYEAARDLARVRGFRYLDASSVAELPVGDVLERVEAIPAPANQPDRVEAAALLGTIPEPRITVTKALELYWTLAREKTFGKSEDQLRRWEAPRNKAIKNFVAVVGDKEIANITRDDMLDFRQHWLDRIEAGEVTANSANKDLIHLGDVLKTVNMMKRLGLALPLGELSFKEGEKKTRPPFSEDWIRTRLLALGALDGLNGQARALLLGMINTGYRPSEGAALTAETIRLDGDVPHISIEPEGRQLKSHYARRVIPLTGVSLEALKQYPEGFPRYRNRATLSAVVNKFLRANGLLETPRHSLYSLRHAFEDRMLAAGIDDRIRRDLFGHRLDRERYGKGASLEHVAELVARIAF